MRSIVLILVGWCLVSACAAHVEPKCSERPVQRDSKPAPAGDDPASRTSEDLGAGSAADRLATAVLGGIPRPKPREFETPERVLGFLVETLASRNIAKSLAAFPIVEHAERVTLKDRLEFTHYLSPTNEPLDDDRYARLHDALVKYLAQDYAVAQQLYGNEASARSVAPGRDAAGMLHELDGPRLALKVASMEEVGNDAPQELSSIDRAIGVTEKRVFKMTVALDRRLVEVLSVVGRVDDNWRVLSLFTGP
ncbi:MAG: hypothetical protein ABUL60_29585 [Myxococcales bacterium]